MKLLVTGAGGFIGEHVVNALLSAGVEVHAVSRQPSAHDGRVRWHTADLMDLARMTAVVRETAATHLVHCAWVTRHGAYWESSENLRWLAASAELTREFVEAGGTRIVLAGTSAEY